MESESKNIIQMLKNVKQIIEVSKERGCWFLGELENINITYHNVSEIARQLQEKSENKQLDESIEVNQEMEDVD